MKKLLLGLACIVGLSTAQASGIAFGSDAIELLDNRQFNIFAQNALNDKSALVVSAAISSATDLEVAYKAYTSNMYDSVYYQLGGVVTGVGSDANTEFGISGKIGYEHSPALHFVFFGNVTATYMFDSNDIQYTPELGLMFTI